MDQVPARTPNWRRLLGKCRRNPGRTAWAALGLTALLAVGLADTLLAEPMRRWAERTMNASLDGYTVHIARLRPHLWRLGFDLDGLDLIQKAHPDPPVADIGVLGFAIAWEELVHKRLAGYMTLTRPALHIDLAQIQEEARGRVRLRDRGWQRAVESIYPIKLDRVKVLDGSLVYLSDRTTARPLQLTKVFMVAKNIRNIAVIPGTFPSPVTLEGDLFGTGKIQFQGAADFLREPYCAAQGQLRLDRVPLDRLAPLAQDYQMKMTGGLLSLHGTLEYTPEVRTAHLAEVRIEDLRLDYITSDATRNLEMEHAREAVKLARQLRNAPKLLLRVDTLSLADSEIGFVNEAAKPPYRLFISKAALDLENLSNQSNLGRSRFKVRGTFMSSGAALVTGNFQPAADPADFTVQLKLENAGLPDLNGLLRSRWGVDVAAGLFSVYAELTVKNRRLEGYLKPLLKDVKIYDRGKDRAKPIGKRVEIHLLQFLAKMFKNGSTQEVATVTTLSGSTSLPKAGEWEAIRKLIGNGLWHAILPGFLDKPAAREAPRPGPTAEGGSAVPAKGTDR